MLKKMIIRSILFLIVFLCMAFPLISFPASSVTYEYLTIKFDNGNLLQQYSNAFLATTTNTPLENYVTNAYSSSPTMSYKIGNGSANLNFTSSVIIENVSFKFRRSATTASGTLYFYFRNFTDDKNIAGLRLTAGSDMLSYYDFVGGWTNIDNLNTGWWYYFGVTVYDNNTVRYYIKDNTGTIFDGYKLPMTALTHMRIASINKTAGVHTPYYCYIDNVSLGVQTLSYVEASFNIGFRDVGGHIFRRYGYNINDSFKPYTLFGYLDSNLFDTPIYLQSMISAIHFENYTFIEGQTYWFKLQLAYRYVWTEAGYIQINYPTQYANFTIYSGKGCTFYISPNATGGVGNEDDYYIGDINGSYHADFRFYDEHDTEFRHLGDKGAFYDSSVYKHRTLWGKITYQLKNTASATVSLNAMGGRFSYYGNFTNGTELLFHLTALSSFETNGNLKIFENMDGTIILVRNHTYNIPLTEDIENIPEDEQDRRQTEEDKESYDLMLGVMFCFGIGGVLAWFLGSVYLFPLGFSASAYMLSQEAMGSFQLLPQEVGVGLIVLMVVGMVIIWLTT